MLRIAVVEDDPACAAILREHLDRFSRDSGEELRVVCFSDGMDIVEDYRPAWDIIFMDIEMPHLDGMTAAERIRGIDPSVVLIFITNMAQYAIRGYAVDAMDYVLKPVSYYAFALKMKKAVELIRSRIRASILLPVDGEVRRVPLADILYVEVQSHYLHYHTAQGEYTMTGSLKEVEKQLSGQDFVRCNSCYLVNLRHVTGVRDGAAVVGDAELQISRPKKREFLRRLTDYVGGAGRQ